jgi:adenylate kinase family enzyme
VAQLTAAPTWVMDGNYGGTLTERIAAADTVVWLDYGRIGCVIRTLWRVATHLGRTRPDMGKGCPERLDLAFLRYIWSFPARHRPRILTALSGRPAGCRLVRLGRPEEARRFLAGLKRGGDAEIRDDTTGAAHA